MNIDVLFHSERDVSDTIVVHKGDYGYDITFTCYDDSTGELDEIDISEYDILFKVWVKGNPDNPIVDAVCTVSDLSHYDCTYTIIDGDFDQTGNYLYEIELTDEHFTIIINSNSGILLVKESGNTI
jgi:hypothetical protein